MSCVFGDDGYDNDIPEDCGVYACNVGANSCYTYCSTGSHCASGYYCSAPTCIQQSGLGGSCSTQEACLPAFYCDYTPDTCQPKKDEYEDCDQNYECLSGYCAGGSLCLD
jgi:hypothetical protein